MKIKGVEKVGGGEEGKFPAVRPPANASYRSVRTSARRGRCDRLRTRASARRAHPRVALLTRQSVKGATPLARRDSPRVLSGHGPSRIQAGVPVPRRASGANSGHGPPFATLRRTLSRVALESNRLSGGSHFGPTWWKPSRQFRSVAPFASLTCATALYNSNHTGKGRKELLPLLAENLI